ncbi:MAG: hypothetical protein HN576_01395 [Bacteriovoracaceae bacterium]|nr:hypothetical protein [Bacteriovoracaceae bacterium]
MMTDISKAIIEVRTSKNELPIPVVNGVHLHSMYNPKKEADSFADKNLELLKEKKKILVLGVGFAYHLESLLDRMNKLNTNKNNHIIVIDPSAALFEECRKNNRLVNSFQIEYICGVDINKLFSNQYFINFLLENPGVIAHPASFNLNKGYFSSFLDYTASTYIEDIHDNIIGEDLKAYVKSSGQNQWHEFADSVFASGSIKHSNDYLVMALKNFNFAQNGEINE